MLNLICNINQRGALITKYSKQSNSNNQNGLIDTGDRYIIEKTAPSGEKDTLTDLGDEFIIERDESTIDKGGLDLDKPTICIGPEEPVSDYEPEKPVIEGDGFKPRTPVSDYEPQVPVHKKDNDIDFDKPTICIGPEEPVSDFEPKLPYEEDVINLIFGTENNDVLIGSSGPDFIYGREGDDFIFGADGHDVIFGGDGNDLIFGGNGNDLIYGDGGGDYLEGGSGRDVFAFSASSVDKNVNVIGDYNFREDVIDFTDIFESVDFEQQNLLGLIEDYLSITTEGDSIVVAVDVDGQGTKAQSENVLYVQNVDTVGIKVTEDITYYGDTLVI